MNTHTQTYKQMSKSNEIFVLIFSFHFRTSNYIYIIHTYICINKNIYTYKCMYMNKNSEEMHKTKASNSNV